MKKRFLVIGLAITFLASFGCALPPKSYVTKLNPTERVLVYEDNYVNSNLTADKILNAIQNDIKTRIDYVELKREYISADTDELFGLRVSRDNENIVVSFVNGPYGKQDNEFRGHEVVGKISYKISNNSNKYTVLLRSPEEIVFNNTSRLPVSWNVPEVPDFSSRISNTFSALKPRIYQEYNEAGEITTANDDRTVFGALQRAFPTNRITTNTETIREGQFWITRNTEARISVYPFNGGAKVYYSFPVSYVLTSDGNSTFSPTVAKEGIEKIKEASM